MKKISWVSLGFIVCIHGICLGFEAKSDIPLIAAYACQTNGVAQSCPPEHPIYGGGMLSNFQHSWIQVINKSNDYVITTANGDEIKLFLMNTNGKIWKDNSECPNIGPYPDPEYGTFIDLLENYGQVDPQGNFTLKPGRSFIGFVDYCWGDQVDDPLPTHGMLLVRTSIQDVPVLYNLGWETFVIKQVDPDGAGGYPPTTYSESVGGTTIDKELLVTTR